MNTQKKSIALNPEIFVGGYHKSITDKKFWKSAVCHKYHFHQEVIVNFVILNDKNWLSTVLVFYDSV